MILQYPDDGLLTSTIDLDLGTKQGIQTAYETVMKLWVAAEECPHAVGLAANQLGIPFSVFLFDTGISSLMTVAINPELISVEPASLMLSPEKCLSLEDQSGPISVPRYAKIKVAYNTFPKMNNRVVMTMEGYPAIVFQHELDHLNGVTINTKTENG